jgi:hypothetical protein
MSVLRDTAACTTPLCELRILGEDIEFSYRFECIAGRWARTRVCRMTRRSRSRFEHLHVPLLGEHQAHQLWRGAVRDGRAQASAGSRSSEQEATDGLAERRTLQGRLELRQRRAAHR